MRNPPPTSPQPPMPPAPPMAKSQPELLLEMHTTLGMKGVGTDRKDIVAALVLNTEALMRINETLAAMLAIMIDVHEKGAEP